MISSNWKIADANRERPSAAQNNKECLLLHFDHNGQLSFLLFYSCCSSSSSSSSSQPGDAHIISEHVPLSTPFLSQPRCELPPGSRPVFSVKAYSSRSAMVKFYFTASGIRPVSLWRIGRTEYELYADLSSRYRVRFPGAVDSKFTTDMKFVKPSDHPAIPTYRVIDSDGVIADSSHGPLNVKDEEVISWYKDMLTVSIMDVIMFDAQRQGRLSFYMVFYSSNIRSEGKRMNSNTFLGLSRRRRHCRGFCSSIDPRRCSIRTIQRDGCFPTTRVHTQGFHEPALCKPQ